MLMNPYDLGFANDDQIRTDDFCFEDNDAHLDSQEHQDTLEHAVYYEDEFDYLNFEDHDDYIDELESDFNHAVECAGGSENYWRNWQAEQEVAETLQNLS